MEKVRRRKSKGKDGQSGLEADRNHVKDDESKTFGRNTEKGIDEDDEDLGDGIQTFKTINGKIEIDKNRDSHRENKKCDRLNGPNLNQINCDKQRRAEEENALRTKGNSTTEKFNRIMDNKTIEKGNGTSKSIMNYESWNNFLRIQFEIDLISLALFLCALWTRLYQLVEPKNIV